MKKPLAERVGRAPDEVVTFLRKQLKAANVTEVIDREFEADLRQALQILPLPFQNSLSNRCAGILVVQNLGASAVTFAIRSSGQMIKQAFMVLDRDWLNHSFSKWSEEKDSRFFRFQENEFLRQLDVPQESDDRVNTLLWILLHEGSHIQQIGDPGIPAFDRRPDVADFNQFAFTKSSWMLDAQGSFRSVFDHNDFPIRREWPFRATKPRLDASRIPQIFEQLRATNFVSFEAAADPFEDFAESFAQFIYVEQMKRPWILGYGRDGKVVASLKSCWNEQRCSDKKSYLQNVWKQIEVDYMQRRPL